MDEPKLLLRPAVFKTLGLIMGVRIRTMLKIKVVAIQNKDYVKNQGSCPTKNADYTFEPKIEQFWQNSTV